MMQSPQMSIQLAESDAVRVWDPVVRIFHWGLVTCMALSFMSAEQSSDAHQALGYAIAALLGLRIVWGLFGTHYARFSQFVRSPRKVLTYLRDVLAAKETRYLGHNPAGGAMVLALLLLIAGTAMTGWWQTTDAGWGLAWVQELHEWLANAVLALVALHLGGVFLASFRHQENLVKAMVTGCKKRPTAGDCS